MGGTAYLETAISSEELPLSGREYSCLSGLVRHNTPDGLEKGLAELDLNVSQLGRGAFRATTERLCLPHMVLVRACLEVEASSDGSVPADCLALGVPLLGMEARWRGLPADFSSCWLAGPGAETHAVNSGDLALGVAVIPMRFIAARAGLPGRLPDLIPGGDRLRACFLHQWGAPGLDTELLDRLVWILEDLAGPAPRLRGRSRFELVARSLRLLRGGGVGGVGELAGALDVPERTLRMAFQEVYGVGPATFLKRRRLQEARRHLERGCDRVSQAATRAGFWHMGQFSQDYQSFFGEAPSATLRKAAVREPSARLADS